MTRKRPCLPVSFEHANGLIHCGTVSSVSRDIVSLAGPSLRAGDVVAFGDEPSEYKIAAQVTRVNADGATCVPLTDIDGLRVGDPYRCEGGRVGAYVGAALLGRELDAWGRNLASQPCVGAMVIPLRSGPVPAGVRVPIRQVLRTGVAAIDAFATIGAGQRIAIVAGAGVGKTTLLHTLVEHADVDVRVVALIGERGRELEEASRRLRSSPHWDSTSLYCTTSDARPSERYAAARSATAQAEWLCRNGRRVLLAVDSMTRVAQAWRETALSAGEPPAARGHPPSLVRALAALLERAGARTDGSITAIYTVLVEGDDPNEPVTDALRAMLDGQIALSRAHADAGCHPAIDVLRSLSRVMPDIVSAGHAADAALVRRALSTLEDASDLMAVGAYREGNDEWLDTCVESRDQIEALIFSDAAHGSDPVVELAAIAQHLRRTPVPSPVRA